MFKQAVTEEIFLRILEVRDAYPLSCLVNTSRQQLRMWLPWVDEVSTAQDTEKFIQLGLNQFAANNGAQLGIWYQDAVSFLRATKSLRVACWQSS